MVFALFVQPEAVRRTSPSQVSLLLGTEPAWAARIRISIAHDGIGIGIGITGYCGIVLILTGTTRLQRVPRLRRTELLFRLATVPVEK